MNLLETASIPLRETSQFSSKRTTRNTLLDEGAFRV